MKRLKCWASLLLLCCPAGHAEICELEDSESSCRVKVWEQAAQQLGMSARDVDEEAKASEAELASEITEMQASSEQSNVVRLGTLNTGVVNPSSVSGTSLSDFLSLLQISADSGGLSSDDGESMTIDLNRFLGIPTDHGYKLTAQLKRPRLYVPLVEELPEEDRASRVKELEKTLNDLDDTTISFSYSPAPKKGTWSRNPALYSATYSSLFQAARARVGNETRRYLELADRREELVQDLIDIIQAQVAEEQSDLDEILAEVQLRIDRLSDETGTLVFSQVARVSEDLASALLAAVEAAEVARVSRLSLLRRELHETRFFQFADLINNQPQLYLSVAATSRDDLVGPDEVKGRITFEKGWVNVNQFRESAASCTSDPSKDALTCFQDYLTPQRIRQIERGDRIAFSLEYSDVDDYSISLSGDELSLDLTGDRRIKAEVAYGRYLGFTPDGGGHRRLDFNWSYEDVGDDPNRQDRSVASLSYSHRVAGDVIFSGGLTWASEPEFLGDVQEELTARLGLSYKLFRPEQF